MFRYFAFLWAPTSVEKTAIADVLERRLCNISPSWRVEYCGDGVRVLVAGHSTALGVRRLAGSTGVVLGEIFVRDKIEDWGAASTGPGGSAG